MKLIISFLLAALLSAQTEDPAMLYRQPAIRAQGSATVSAKPDQVRIDIGVVTQAQTAQAAGTANAKQFTEVVAELKKILGEGSDVQTVSYGISPNYKYPKEGGTPTITGYTATNVVRATSSDIASSGKVIDIATKSGANTIRGIEFRLKDEQALRAKALADAARKARANVDAMASGLGLKVVRILRVEDERPVQVLPVRQMMMEAKSAAMDSVATPIEAGDIQVEARVVLTAEIAP